jgi:sugar lactone lactonase YvrE
VGTLSTSFWSFNSGNLAFGPDGSLYVDVWPTSSKDTTLYRVNTTTGVATTVGSGLGSADPLALVTVGSTLYGIDTFVPTTPAIYTIDTTTGLATEIGTVSGLTAGYTLDTMGGSVPEPATITLLGTGTLVLLVFSRRARRTSCKG